MSGLDDKIIVARGEWGSVVCAIRRSGSVPAEKYLNGLKKKRPREYWKFVGLFQKTVSKGRIKDKKQFKHLHDGIHEFKVSNERIACFETDFCWVLTHGFPKGRSTKMNLDIKRAQDIRQEYLDRTR